MLIDRLVVRRRRHGGSPTRASTRQPIAKRPWRLSLAGARGRQDRGQGAALLTSGAANQERIRVYPLRSALRAPPCLGSRR